ncbi:hypothetical protein OROHE_006633 [Orobanche hederae]
MLLQILQARQIFVPTFWNLRQQEIILLLAIIVLLQDLQISLKFLLYWSHLY